MPHEPLPAQTGPGAPMASDPAAIDPLAILADVYPKGSPAADILTTHSRQVRDKALAVAARVRELNPDMRFIEEAAWLHDIGICRTAAPDIGCHGDQPYVRHGVIGRSMLEARGLKRHALVCERHVGVGITAAEIRRRRLPLPVRDMIPVSLEETIVCYADKFFSKTRVGTELPLDAIVREIKRYGPDKVRRFMEWHTRFSR